VIKEQFNEAAELLEQILAIPSLSREEEQVCSFLENWLKSKGYKVNRKYNNIWIESIAGKDLPTILLNSHMDTVKPTSAWTLDPFLPEKKDGKIYGLGSNDAGGSIVSLIFAFMHLEKLRDRMYNLILALSSEEEVSGIRGISSIISDLGKFDLAIIGEPTSMKMATCERGLIVLDCYGRGKAGHAAHRNGENAIIKVMKDIEILESLKFEKKSEFLGEIGLSVTQIEGGIQHNIIPDLCKFVVDVRTNEHYTNEEIVNIIKSRISSEVVPRSMHLASSSLDQTHPLVVKAIGIGIETFGSKTLSDQSLISKPTVKIGPGDSERSHQADEFIFIHEIKQAIDQYIKLLTGFRIKK
jgi:acetylornithine deacetylase